MDNSLTWQSTYVSTQELESCLMGNIKLLPMKVKDKSRTSILTMII